MDEIKTIKLFTDAGVIKIRTRLDVSMIQLLVKHNDDVKFFVVERDKVML